MQAEIHRLRPRLGMKARPRGVEREIAALLSGLFFTIGASPVQRIPVLGRTGPDLTVNEIGLVIDVKSRLEVPKGIMHAQLVQSGSLIGVPLDQLALLASENEPLQLPIISATVERWYAHMDAWTQANLPQGISTLVLHRPKMPYGKAMVLIHINNRRRLIERWSHTQSRLSNPATTQFSPMPCAASKAS